MESFKRHKEDWNCPLCHGVIEYMGTDEMFDEVVQYYTCSECKCKFKEIFTLKYDRTEYEKGNN